MFIQLAPCCRMGMVVSAAVSGIPIIETLEQNPGTNNKSGPKPKLVAAAKQQSGPAKNSGKDGPGGAGGKSGTSVTNNLTQIN